MKKHLIYLCMASLLGMTACEDDFNKENFKGLDEMTAPQNVLDKDYTLTEADYKTISGLKVEGIETADLKAVEKSQYLTSASDPRVVLPVFLAKNWKTASLDATLRLTFNYVQDVPSYLKDIAGASSYELKLDDYKTVWGAENIDYLAPARNPEKYLPNILQNAVSGAVKDDYVVAAYQYSDNDPDGDWTDEDNSIELVNESFANGQGAFTIDNQVLPDALTYVWMHDSHGYMKASAYKGGGYDSESWLISPAMNMSEILGATLTFEHAINYGSAASYAEQMSLWISVDGEDWQQLTIPNIPEKGSWTFVESGDIDLTAYVGKENVRLAFKYTSTTAAAATWEVKNVKVNGLIAVFQPNLEMDGESFVKENKILPDALTYVWTYDSYGYMKASAYKGTNYAAESWLISPTIALNSVEAPVTLTFEHAINYGSAASYAEHMTLWVSEDGEDWQQLTIPNIPEKGSWTFIKSGDIDLSDYVGKSIKIAFKYLSTASAAATWEVKNILIKGQLVSSSSAEVSTSAVSVSASSEIIYSLCKYNGAKWVVAGNAVVLTPTDYEAIGVSTGYFTADAPANNYLSRFLSQKYPYSQELDTMIVVYNYSNVTTLKADEYVFADGAWKCTTQPVTAVTEQYALAADGWVYSPDVVVVLKPGRGAEVTYFQKLTDWVWENVDQKEGGLTEEEKGKGYVTSYGNNDYYYGGSQYQNNFDFRPAAWRTQNEDAYGKMSDEELTELMWKRLPEGIEHMLDTMYPDMVQTDEPISYVLKFGIYGIDGSSATKYYSIRCKLVGKGKFSYVEGSLKEISGL